MSPAWICLQRRLIRDARKLDPHLNPIAGDWIRLHSRRLERRRGLDPHVNPIAGNWIRLHHRVLERRITAGPHLNAIVADWIRLHSRGLESPISEETEAHVFGLESAGVRVRVGTAALPAREHRLSLRLEPALKRLSLGSFATSFARAGCASRRVRRLLAMTAWSLGEDKNERKNRRQTAVKKLSR